LLPGQVSVEAEATGTGLVDKLQGCGLTLELVDEFVDGIDAILELSVMTHRSIEAVGGDSHIVGFLMNIHSDKECAKF
jgi:hypothetical protein